LGGKSDLGVIYGIRQMIDQRIELALKSDEPVLELRNLAQRLLVEGETREAVLDLFERARQQLRTTDQETKEEAVMDVMDFLVGWCSPHMKLPPEQAGLGSSG
jgi:hypothetical protein